MGHTRLGTLPATRSWNEVVGLVAEAARMGKLRLFRGRYDYEIVAEMETWAADDERGRRLNSSHELTERPRGMLQVRLRLDSLEEAERWVLSLGTHATVIRPDKLRERLFKATEELWQRYGGPMVIAGRDEG
jgi:predicted DNA-binding transcriptional regulator YafY